MPLNFESHPHLDPDLVLFEGFFSFACSFTKNYILIRQMAPRNTVRQPYCVLVCCCAASAQQSHLRHFPQLGLGGGLPSRKAALH